jgi:plasmid replication initiation protein
MRGYQSYKMQAVQARFQLAVRKIVERHRTNGEVLTWRLVHKIEKEAIDMLKKSGDLESQYIKRVRLSEWGFIPEVDEPVELPERVPLPTALTVIEQAYHSYH